MTVLAGTYRLQLRAGVSLADARRLVTYLDRLGVSHLYLSPVLRARSGSTHGYDVVDPTQVDPALGGKRALARLARALRARNMAVLLDIVPNHVAADAENPFFDDVLAHGTASRYARWFDVDWGAPGSRGRLVVPVLGAPRSEAIGRGELALLWTGRRIRLRYFARSFPLDPATLPEILEPLARALGPRAAARRRLEAVCERLRALPPRARAPQGVDRAGAAALLEDAFARLVGCSGALRRVLSTELERFARDASGRRRLARLLSRQAYRLHYWRRGRHVLNYRRFFDVNELVALRMEDPEVFSETHARVFELVRSGRVEGLRVDHVDGLLDPRVYLTRLREELEAGLSASRRRPVPASPLLVVEKILARDEGLRDEWPVSGTTGYEFLNQSEDALLHARGAGAVSAAWARATGFRASFAETQVEAKRLVLTTRLDADLNRLARRLARLLDSTSAPGKRRPSQRALRTAIGETVAHLRVYRTYVDARGELAESDRRAIDVALAGARAAGRAAPRALGPLARVLRLEGIARTTPDDRRRWLGFVERFQQLSGPVAAKGVEDTALYVYVPLLARNEVGGDPGAPLDDAVTVLHAANAERRRRWPHGLLAASTHDTKRSADVRARIDVLSEIPSQWAAAVARWRRANRELRRRAGRNPVPDANTEYVLYQTLVGVWPLAAGGGPVGMPEAPVLLELRNRLEAYMEKAAREAKVRTSWIEPRPAFEDGLRRFVRRVLDPEDPTARPFLADVARLVSGIARPGLWNALARTLVQLASPGIPDLYQGEELFTFSLVDPDNRRPVDFARCSRLLREVERRFGAGGARRSVFLRELRERPEDGRVKLHVWRAGLAARRRAPSLFTTGEYVPLEVRGARARHVLAFARREGRRVAIAVAPRLSLTLLGDPYRAPVGVGVWGTTSVRVPRALARRRLVSVLTGAGLRPAPSRGFVSLPVAALLEELPVGLWLVR